MRERAPHLLLSCALVISATRDVSAAPAVARDPINGTSHSINQNPDGTFDILLSTTVITQPTTFTVIGAASDRLNLVEVSAGVPQLVFVNIRGSSGGTVQSVNQIDMGASTSTVLVNELRTSGDVGSIFVNTIVDATIGGNLTGGINLLPRSSGGPATLIGATVQGRILGDVIVDHGDILSLIATGGIGMPGAPVQIRTSGNLVKLIAGEIHADISTLWGGAGGLTSELRTTLGSLVGSLSTRGIGATEPGSVGAVSIAGNLDADVVIVEDIENDNGGQPVFVIGGSFASSREISIGRSLLSGAEIRIGANTGLKGQILINAGDLGGAWLGSVRVGASILGPVPSYTATSASLGGGAVGVVRFAPHLPDSSPPAGSILDGTTAPSPNNPIILNHYGPVRWDTLDAPLVVERRAVGSSGNWSDVTACTLIGRPGGADASANTLAIFPIAPLPSGFTYRINPVLDGANRLQCDLGLQTNPSVASPATPYTLSILGGCIGDANRDGVVNFTDITSVLSNWSSTNICSPLGDANLNGVINFNDISSVLANWGVQCLETSSRAHRGPQVGRALELAASQLGFASVDMLEAWMHDRSEPRLRERVIELGIGLGSSAASIADSPLD